MNTGLYSVSVWQRCVKIMIFCTLKAFKLVSLGRGGEKAFELVFLKRHSGMKPKNPKS